MDFNKLWQNFVDTVTNHYLDFNGRMGRAQYWYYILVVFVLAIGVAIVASVTTRALSSLFSLALLLPNLGMTVRRLHVSGLLGFWVVLLLFFGVLLFLFGLFVFHRCIRDDHLAAVARRYGCADLFLRTAGTGWGQHVWSAAAGVDAGAVAARQLTAQTPSPSGGGVLL